MKPETREWVQKAEKDWLLSRKVISASSRRETFHDQACFHCQQSAEKYLKALLQESGEVVPRTHDLVDLLDRVQVLGESFRALRLAAAILTPYSVLYRYPGVSATKRQARAALRHAEKVRAAMRSRLGLTD